MLTSTNSTEWYRQCYLQLSNTNRRSIFDCFGKCSDIIMFTNIHYKRISYVDAHTQHTAKIQNFTVHVL
jgi:hypothetical protein